MTAPNRLCDGSGQLLQPHLTDEGEDAGAEWVHCPGCAACSRNALPLDAEALKYIEDNGPSDIGPITLAALCLQSHAALSLRDELAEAERLNDMLASICKRTAVALKGPEPDMGLHTWADLPEVAAKAVVKP